jgi:hypothetical protein
MLSNMYPRSYFVGAEMGDLWWVTVADRSAGECMTDGILTQARLSVGSNVRGSVLGVALEADTVSAEILRNTIASRWHRRAHDPRWASQELDARRRTRKLCRVRLTARVEIK